ncbi:uncharacterized protein V6R79_003489 [Siganus canaliculatus]
MMLVMALELSILGFSNATTATFSYQELLLVVGKNIIVIVLGLSINYINATMVHTFSKHHIFVSNPRFILFIHLVINDMLQLTISISMFVITYTIRTIYVPVCCLLILPAIITTQNTPLNLAFLAVECYIAVNIPLRHNSICTVKRTYIAISVIWTLSSASLLPDIFIVAITESAEFINARVYCSRDTMFRNNYSQKKRDALHILFLVVVWLTLLYTYFSILFVAKAADADAKKAKNTILIHGFQVGTIHQITSSTSVALSFRIFNMNPRYILYIHLIINDILLLSLLTIMQVINYTMFTFNAALCMLLLLFIVPVSQNNPLTLAVMAVECYVAVCFPLKHPNICTVKKTYVVIGLIWTINTLMILPDLFVVLATESLEFFQSRVVCLADHIFKKPYYNEKREVWYIMYFVIVLFILLYTYLRIFFAAHAAAAESKKARNTVLLHSFQLILCMLLYFYYLIIQGLAKLFPKDIRAIRYTVNILILVLPRLISPVVYGLRDKMFKQYLMRYSLFRST